MPLFVGLYEKMRIFYTRSKLEKFCIESQGRLSFVPTMGALHDGHMKLVQAAKNDGSLVLVSIFINPKQFNNPNDLKTYPVNLLSDLRLLKQYDVDAVFIPTAEEVYPKGTTSRVLLPKVASVWEGAYREGHFQGVVDVLTSFYNLIKPSGVYFGQKDLQQCMVVREMMNSYFPNIKFHMVSTHREKSGLAYSSRNERLSEEGRSAASQIFNSLNSLKNNFNEKCLSEEKKNITNAGIEIEYLEKIGLPEMEIDHSDSNRGAIIFAGYLEGVRLIDNMLLEVLET